MKFYDYLFEFTEFSDNEGEQILVRETDLESAWDTLIERHGFKKRELCFIERMETWQGEMLGFDIY